MDCKWFRNVESVELYERWRELAEALLDPALLDQLPVMATGKGRHVYFRMPEPVGNLRLAMDGKELLVETRGQGGYHAQTPFRAFCILDHGAMYGPQCGRQRGS